MSKRSATSFPNPRHLRKGSPTGPLKGRHEVLGRIDVAHRALDPRASVPRALIPLQVRRDSEQSSISGSSEGCIQSSTSGVEVGLPHERHRSALKTRLDILLSVRDAGPSSQSRIISMGNLSKHRAIKYLGELVSLGLLTEDTENEMRSYGLTSRGLEFVNQLRETETFVASFGLTI